jgi:battenin
MSLTYFLLLPPLSAFSPSSPFAAASSEPVGGSSSSPLLARSSSEGEGVVDEDEQEEEEDRLAQKELEERERLPSLTTREKIELARPLVKRFMLPLFFVYLAGASPPPFLLLALLRSVS